MPWCVLVALLLLAQCEPAPQQPQSQLLPGVEQLEELDIPAMRAKMRAMPPADPNED
mgnify:CR=1 FL=1